MRNRFKGLDLIDRVPDELWMEVHDIVCTGGRIKTIPKKKKCKKAKKNAKGKGDMERYIHLNAEFQRLVRRNKKAILSDR